MMAMKIKPTIKATVIVVAVITDPPQASDYITITSNWLMPDFRAGTGRENEKIAEIPLAAAIDCIGHLKARDKILYLKS
jgi:hypothetical protein